MSEDANEQADGTVELRDRQWSARVQCSGLAKIVSELYEMLDEREAQNYIELRFEVPSGGNPVIVTIHRPGGKTPHELRMEAEAEVERLKGGAR